MNTKLRQIARLLKRYDSNLYPKKYLTGAMGIVRKKRRWGHHKLPDGSTLWFGYDDDQLVLPITDNWTESGKPVDWGIEPIFWKIQQLDGWRDDGDYDRFCAQRDQNKRNSERARRNELKALAYDCRREFAQATNEINTSTLEKIDKRRSAWPS